MEEKENMPQKNEGGECCSSDSGSLKSLKTAIFVLVIIAACALAAHSVLTKGTNSPCSGSPAGLCPFNKTCAPGGACVLEKSDANNTGCLIKEKANNPSPCCPNAETPSNCPKAAVPGCYPNAGSN
jgi:hypothetical protein